MLKHRRKDFGRLLLLLLLLVRKFGNVYTKKKVDFGLKSINAYSKLMDREERERTFAFVGLDWIIF